MIKLHKKNLLSLRNKTIRANKKFKYELVRVALIALISGITFTVVYQLAILIFYKLARLIPIVGFN